jgi:exodeoxyribonuclease-5
VKKRRDASLMFVEPPEDEPRALVSDLVLSRDQAEVYSDMRDWAAKPKGILRVGGYAGTGKTTLLGKFAAESKLLIAYVAYTGRASSILARKLKEGSVATTGKTLGPKSSEVSYTSKSPERKLPFVGTIHRLLYRPVISPTEELLGWKKRETLDRAYDLIVVDEASMVGDEILYDLKEYGVPVMAVGDHGQLPPVMDSGALMQNPDLRLERIHRQALGSPIIALSQHVREGEWLDDFEGDGRALKGGEVVFGRKKHVGAVIEDAYKKREPRDVIIVSWSNRSRVMLNGAARRALGHEGPPKAGEVVVCLKNSPPVYNGMRGILSEDAAMGGKPWHLDMLVSFPEDGIEPQTVTANATQFNRKNTYDNVEQLVERGIRVDRMSEGGELYDFGYALTCHKCQGSQAPHVIVFCDMPEKPKQEQWRRWIYTATTRASEKLTILIR